MWERPWLLQASEHENVAPPPPGPSFVDQQTRNFTVFSSTTSLANSAHFGFHWACIPKRVIFWGGRSGEFQHAPQLVYTVFRDMAKPCQNASTRVKFGRRFPKRAKPRHKFPACWMSHLCYLCGFSECLYLAALCLGFRLQGVNVGSPSCSFVSCRPHSEDGDRAQLVAGLERLCGRHSEPQRPSERRRGL